MRLEQYSVTVFNIPYNGEREKEKEREDKLKEERERKTLTVRRFDYFQF